MDSTPWSLVPNRINFSPRHEHWSLGHGLDLILECLDILIIKLLP
jgi:hypothetical protein